MPGLFSGRPKIFPGPLSRIQRRREPQVQLENIDTSIVEEQTFETFESEPLEFIPVKEPQLDSDQLGEIDQLRVERSDDHEMSPTEKMVHKYVLKMAAQTGSTIESVLNCNPVRNYASTLEVKLTNLRF